MHYCTIHCVNTEVDTRSILERCHPKPCRCVFLVCLRLVSVLYIILVLVFPDMTLRAELVQKSMSTYSETICFIVLETNIMIIIQMSSCDTTDQMKGRITPKSIQHNTNVLGSPDRHKAFKFRSTLASPKTTPIRTPHLHFAP